MTDETTRIVILGAGHAGGAMAAQLRSYGFPGEILLVGDEPQAPYQRPPLSKAFLKGETNVEALKLRADHYYIEHAISLHLGGRATAIDRARRQVALEGGLSVGYDILVIATGARARALPIPGADLGGVRALRSLEDAERLREVLEPGRCLAIVGGGYIGLEAAATARALGAEAVVIEREARVLARVACPELSEFFETYHRAQGVEILPDAVVSDLIGDERGQVRAVRLGDGREIACDAVLVGVGAVPNLELARDAGLACENGIEVDLEARTADPAIFAIGDVTWRPMPLYDRRHRLESVPNALEQAKQASAAICGRPAPPPEVPWFWSDQFELKLQIAGIPFDADSRILRGSTADAKFAVFHLKGDRVQAVEAVNAVPEFLAGRQLIGQGRAVDPNKLADPAISMKQVAA